MSEEGGKKDTQVIELTMGKKRKEVRYQSVRIAYPEKLYLPTIIIYLKNGDKISFVLYGLYEEPKYAFRAAKTLCTRLKKEKIATSNWVAIATLKFIEKTPLKKEYWQKPKYIYNVKTRAVEITKSLLDNKNYKLLVTPTKAKKGKLVAAIAFLKDVRAEDVEIFMLTSDWYVDPEADSAAFYAIETITSIDVHTKEIYNHAILTGKRKKHIN